MSLPHGGHLTHGSKVSFSGKWFNAVHYGVDKDTEDIDYDQVEALAREHRPKVILAGGSAIPRLIDFERFRAIADEVGAIFWVDAAHFIGLVAGRAIPSPVPYADVVSFTTHKVLRGPRSGAIVCKAEHAAAIDKAVFPMMQGGPQMHCDRGQGGQLQGVRDARVRRSTPRRSSRNAQRPRGRPRRARHPPDDRRHRHPPVPARPAGHRGHRAGRRGPRRRGRHRAEQERHPVRPAEAQRRVRHPGRHAVRDDAGHGGAGDAHASPSSSRRAVTDGDADPDHPVTKEVRAEVTDLVTRFPAYPRPGAARG